MDCVQPLLVGEPAPFNGQLMSFRRAAKVAVQASGCSERVQLEEERVQKLAAVDIGLERNLRKSDKAHWELEKSLLLGELKRIVRPWYEHPAVVVPVTVMLTGALFYAGVQTVKATK